MWRTAKTTIITGAIVCLPVFAIGTLAMQSLKAFGSVLRPLVDKLDLDTRLGAVLAAALSVLALLAIVYLLGLLARHGPVSRWLEDVNRALIARSQSLAIAAGSRSN